MLAETDAEEIGEDEEEEEEGNPHFWLDPARASMMAENLADGLIAIAPEYADQITVNLRKLQLALADLSDELSNGLADCPSVDVVVFHEALPYLAEACRLNPVAVVSKESDDSLTASMLVQLIRFIQDRSVSPLILKTLEADPYQDVLTAETGVFFCALDPLTSGPDDPPLDYYETVMRENLRLIQSGLAR